MAIYKLTQSKLTAIKDKPYKLEREIQRLFEENLPAIMGVEVVKSEFTIKNKRIDTLAFDPQTKAFIIIEYKRDRNSSVVHQGFTYLSLMLQNKSEFVLEYNECKGKTLKRDEIDWSQTRVAFVSTGFTDNQREATNFKDLAIELWEVKRYENDIISINHIRKSQAAESIKPVVQNKKELKAVTEEIKVYTEDDHLQNKPDSVIELYDSFKDSILNLSPDIEIEPQKLYIAFKHKENNISDIEIQKGGLKIFINVKSGQLDDPKNLARDVNGIGHWGNGDYELKATDDKNMEYIMSLIKQAIRN